MNEAIISHHKNQDGTITTKIDCKRLRSGNPYDEIKEVTLTPIKLSTLECIDRVKKHLLSQGDTCYNEAGNCMYLNNKGQSCAIGILLVESGNYSPALEDLPALSLCELGLFPNANARVLNSLQTIHDGFETDVWEKELTRLEAEYLDSQGS